MPFSMIAVQSALQNSGDIALALLTHYHQFARDLPWRVPPRRGKNALPDPYHVWLSEVMLQQTTVAAVIPYFEKFRRDWPDFSALAAAADADVMAAWAGLGYYARARNLIACARKVTSDHNGQLPATEGELLKLPGIGAYTAAAIAAIAFGARAIVLDANIERVVSRLFAIDTPLPKSKPEIRLHLEAITPQQQSGDFAQALMDLGAGICSVKAPKCEKCPIRSFCRAAKAENAEAYPIKSVKPAKPMRSGTVYWIQNDDAVWLVQRPNMGMLGGMRALPDDNWSARNNGDAIAPGNAEWQILADTVQHSFTHFSLELQIAVTASAIDETQLPIGVFWPVNSLDKAGLPTLFSKAAKIVARHQCDHGEI
jgi:A/G-specific adenine glycosylase